MIASTISLMMCQILLNQVIRQLMKMDGMTTYLQVSTQTMLLAPVCCPRQWACDILHVVCFNAANHVVLYADQSSSVASCTTSFLHLLFTSYNSILSWDVHRSSQLRISLSCPDMSWLDCALLEYCWFYLYCIIVQERYMLYTFCMTVGLYPF